MRKACRGMLVTLFFFAVWLVTLPAPAIAKTYSKILESFPINLDPAKLEDDNSVQVFVQTSEGLVRYDDNVLKPAIAQRWDISEDATTYTFYLRADAKFSNGQPIVVRDVIESLAHVLRKGSISWNDISIIKGAKDFHAGNVTTIAGLTEVSEKILKVEIESPFSPLLDILASSNYVILPASSMAKLNKEHLTAFVSSGPYTIASIHPGKCIKLRKNLHYYDEKHVYFDEVHYDLVQNKAQAVEGFRSGRYHDIWPYTITDVSPELKRNIATVPALSAFTTYLELNPKRGSLVKKPIREFITNHLDVDSFLVEAHLPAHYKATGFIPKGMLGYSEQSTIEQKRFTKEAGIHFLERHGCSQKSPCVVPLVYSYDLETAVRALLGPLAPFLEQLRVVAQKVPREEWYKKLTQRSFSMILLTRTPSYHDTHMFLRMFLNDSPTATFKHDRICALMGRALATNTKLDRGRVYAEVNQLLMKTHNIFPIYHGDVPYRQVRKDLSGYSISLLGYPYLKIMDIRENNTSVD